ncbi:MAG: hypothetical protein LBS81_02360 [Endomicrobium sp.]|nr:hypothetical protein [Endomicrobium sp.]
MICRRIKISFCQAVELMKMTAYDFTKERLIDDSLNILTKNIPLKAQDLILRSV